MAIAVDLDVKYQTKPTNPVIISTKLFPILTTCFREKILKFFVVAISHVPWQSCFSCQISFSSFFEVRLVTISAKSFLFLTTFKIHT